MGKNSRKIAVWLPSDFFFISFRMLNMMALKKKNSVKLPLKVKVKKSVFPKIMFLSLKSQKLIFSNIFIQVYF